MLSCVISSSRAIVSRNVARCLPTRCFADVSIDTATSHGRLYTTSYNRFAQSKVVNYPNGSIKEGIWKNGKIVGQGKVTHADGTTLEGEFMNNRIVNGKGTKVFKSGDTAEGEWLDGQLHGQGKYTYVTGEVLEGEFKDTIFSRTAGSRKESG